MALLVSLFAALAMTACGSSVGDDDDEALIGSNMVVTPSTVELSVGDLMDNCFAVDNGFNIDQVIQVDIRDVNGNPLGGVNVIAIIDFAENNTDLINVTQLWRDVNNNQVIDASDELANESGDDALDIQTNSNGVARFIVRYSAGCEFRANLLLLTDGGPSSTISIEVTEST